MMAYPYPTCPRCNQRQGDYKVCDKCRNAEEAKLCAQVARLRDALTPFAAITPSSFYPEDGSEAEGYVVSLAIDCSDFTGTDLARARAALQGSQPAEKEEA